MKDPCQHLSFENNENNKTGEISFWVRHVSPTGQPETLVVANLQFSLSVQFPNYILNQKNSRI